jgi:RNA polymerase sigma-70 factor, ECF subfamily
VASAAFADVYEELLPAVWRFVSSRVPERSDAEDLTSEVFTRALESWARYDPSRGTPLAWVFGIAHRVVVDRWRGQARRTDAIDEAALAATDADPGEGVETAEILAELRRVLAGLSERERDAVALRFAAGLRHGEIALILGLSTGAVKMTVFRALLKLRAALAQELASATDDEAMATSLDEAIGAVIARRRAFIPDPLLARVVQLMAALHRPDVPEEVRTRVQACVSCDTLKASADEARRLRLGPLTVPIPAAIRMLTAPACVVCATHPLTHAPLVALGLGGAAITLHASLALLAPLNALLLWRSFRRHGRAAPLILGLAGVALIMAHLTGHVLGSGMDLGQPTFPEMAAGIWGGSALVALATYLDRRPLTPPRLAPRTAAA